jgi:ABC-2 type transport system ATP-binding protein
MPDLPEPADPRRGSGALDGAPLPEAITVKPEGELSAPRSSRVTVTRLEEPILLFEQVSKWYGPVIGVNQITLELRPGITGLVGSNGAGKSTMMRLATGQLRPDLGRVRVLGHDAWSPDAKRHVGYCPDSDVFYEEMSGRQFVLAMARLCGFSRSDARRRTEEVLQLVGMADRADRTIRGYSKGMRQRVKLAQALVHDPELLILDEPLSGIDPIGRRESVAIFNELAKRGKCLLVSSHELEELEKLTDHVAIMAAGRIGAVGTLPQIRAMQDQKPLSVRVVCTQARRLAGELITRYSVLGVDLTEDDSLVVRARRARAFFHDLTALVLEENFDVKHVQTLDESAHAVVGYVLGAR